ncbi:hypothetical protein V5O48_013038 [Marasmius crinis-equi]|uniref:Amidohydrolase-related domain-containing protein n=1 Tax=Marasmius crinis-equi TaxID=585013 RepID=A0ABR3F173_9AGAR
MLQYHRTLLRKLVFFVAALALFHLLANYYATRDGPFDALITYYSLNTYEEWKDDMPYYEQTPHDISTDYPYPRVLEFDVREGTWLRLDVHPFSGDIVFDMLGDLYCMSAEEAYAFNGVPARARPILMGIPYDVEPRFSPEGDRLAFRSDAGLGVENLWIMPWRSCEEMDLRPSAGVQSSRLSGALSVKAAEDQLLAHGVKETRKRRENRLIREGRLEAQRVSNETWRTVTAPRFHPSGEKVIGTKWYQGYVTLGAPEGWEYSLPDLDADQPPSSVIQGSGKRVLGRILPPGYSMDDYPNLQVGPEQFTFNGEDSIIYAKNVVDTFTTSQEKDPFKGIFAIISRNMTTGKEETLVDAVPGSAMRPELSRDGRTLAFVRRSRGHGALVLNSQKIFGLNADRDLISGTIRHVWDGLSTEFSTIWSASSGPYPSFAFAPRDEAIVIWARGQICYVPLTENKLGEKVAGGTPQPIPFVAHVEQQIAETRSASIDLVGLETQETQRVHAFKDLRVDDTGSRAVVQAAGVSVVQVMGKPNVTAVPVLHPEMPYYTPSFVPGANHLVLHARWSDTKFSSFELADLDTVSVFEFTGIPLGRYFGPVLSPPLSDHLTRRIAFVKSAGDILTGYVVATAKPGIYVGTVVLPQETRYKSLTRIPVTDLHFVSSNVDTVAIREIVLSFPSESLLLVHDTHHSFTIDLSVGPNEAGEYDTNVLANGKVVNEIASTFDADRDYQAFVEYSHVYLAATNNLEREEIMSLSAKPRSSTRGLARLSDHGGHSITWSRDFKMLFWLLGPFIRSIEVSNLEQCASEIRRDPERFGISCIDKLVNRQEIFVYHATDISRLKYDIRESANTSGHDVLAVVNATLLTMATGNQSEDYVPDGSFVIRSGLIEDVGPTSEVAIPVNATIIDAEGAFVMPGFFDAHAHWHGPYLRYPAKSWEMQTFLAYGVTTMHNPSSGTVTGFIERTRLESGQMIGPRIFSAGAPIFAGTWPGLHEEIVDDEQAYSALYRIKAEGGSFSHSYKNYNLPSRASRQRLLKASKTLGMLCVPEGAGNLDWGLTYITDGMTTHEHNLPVPALYDDVMQLFSRSGTGYTPTYLVFYGSPPGENYVWANHDVPGDPKLRKFMPHDALEVLTEATATPLHAYTLFNASVSTTKMSRMGLPIHIGAHGENPKGHNFHAEMFFAKQGGLSNYEVLQAAISNGPKTFGFFTSIGSLSPGKLADFLVFEPGLDLLNGPIENTRGLRMVARGGRVWNASTLVEVWPRSGQVQDMPPLNAD